MTYKAQYSRVHGLWELLDTETKESLGLYETLLDALEAGELLLELEPPLMEDEEVWG